MLQIMRIVGSLLLLLLSMPNSPAHSKAVSHPDEVLLVHPWIAQSYPNPRVDLEAKIVQDPEGTGTGSLRIFSGNNVIYADDRRLFPDSVFNLDNGNLAVIWGHANGACTLDVFKYLHDKVSKVIEAGPVKMRPEFVYQMNGHIRGRPYYQQRIIVAKTDWIEDSSPSHKIELLPVSADIYTWNTNTSSYKIRRNVPWNKRLQKL